MLSGKYSAGEFDQRQIFSNKKKMVNGPGKFLKPFTITLK